MLSFKQISVLGVIIVAVLVSGLLILNNHPVIKPVPAHGNFTAGDVYEYQISSISGKSDTTYPLIETVLSSHSEGIQLEIIRNSSRNITTEQKILVDIDTDGKIIKTNSPTPIIPEIQPELPGIFGPLRNYPDSSSEGNWTVQKNGTYVMNGTEIQYSATANGTYENRGMKQISVGAGTYDCIEVISETEFTFSQIINGPQGRVWVDTRGKITGPTWIDTRSGIVIKSDHSINKTVSIDQHEIYQSMGLGIDQMYREIPSKSRIMCELVKSDLPAARNLSQVLYGITGN